MTDNDVTGTALTGTDVTGTDRARVSPSAVSDAARYLDTWLAFRRRQDRVPGVQAAVLHGTEVVMSTAHGVADVETSAPLTPAHLFRIASHSKTFTATAVMQLVQRGTVGLDDPAGRWLPFLSDAGSPLAHVTLRELLAHGAGVVRDGWDGDFWQLSRAFPDHEQLRRIALDGANVLPRNERFKYSNIGYSLLGMVVEEATGRPYADVVRDGVLRPLGLSDTGPELDPQRSGEYATGYTALAYGGVDGNRRLPIEHVDTAAMAAATGFFSTAQDVVRYVAAHFPGDDRLLDDDSKRLMQRTEWQVEGGDDAYALGFAVAPLGGRRLLGHGGGYPGHLTRTLFDPRDRVAVSVLTNAIDGPALTYASAAFRLLDLAAGGPHDTAGSRDTTSTGTTSGSDLTRFRGRFANLWGVYDVVDLGGRLYQLDPTQDDPTHEATHLAVVDDRTLRIVRTRGYGSYGETLHYDVADDGSVRSVRGGSAQTAYPLNAVQAAVTHRERITLRSPLTP